MDGDSRACACARTVPENPAIAWDGSAPLRLGKRWALGADDLQWIVLRARTHRGRTKWQAIAFMRSTKAVLTRVLRENGVICPRTARPL